MRNGIVFAPTLLAAPATALEHQHHQDDWPLMGIIGNQTGPRGNMAFMRIVAE